MMSKREIIYIYNDVWAHLLAHEIMDNSKRMTFRNIFLNNTLIPCKKQFSICKHFHMYVSVTQP